VNDSPAERHQAAARDAMAADNHERAANLWDEPADRARAVLQREIAAFERDGAALERRSARIMDPDGPMTTRRRTELMLGRTREGARALSEKLAMAADALETSAELAEEHAKRRQASGQRADAADELQGAKRAREAALRARSEAEKWLKVTESLEYRSIERSA
jgi:hypothetical protein